MLNAYLDAEVESAGLEVELAAVDLLRRDFWS